MLIVKEDGVYIREAQSVFHVHHWKYGICNGKKLQNLHNNKKTIKN